MLVTKVESVTKVRYKVDIEGKFAFVLYKGELSACHIAEGREIAEEEVARIKTEIIAKRAKRKAMHLLNDMDRTESQLRFKLKQGLYTEDIIDEAVAYVKSFGYINDENYIRRFIDSKKRTKSRAEIYAALAKKGINRLSVEAIMDECYEGGDAREAVEQIIKRKKYNPETATEEERLKIAGYLTRKGFRYEDIRQVIQVSDGSA